MLSGERLYQKTIQAEQFEDPGIIKALFNSPRMAPIWTVLRVYLGWQWLTAGIEKVNNPAWTRTGIALQGFWTNAVKIEPGQKGAAIHYGWYHDFLKYMLDNQWYTWFGKVIAFGETAIGVALIIGAFVGIAAFFGATLNLSYLFAGTASSNPVLLGIAILLVLAWKVAGFIGADYYLLQFLGTPWKAGHFADWAGKTHRAGQRRTVAGFGLFVAIFSLAAALVVGANNQLVAEHPFLGGIVALAIVVVAWMATEATVHLTHSFGLGGEKPGPVLTSRPLV